MRIEFKIFFTIFLIYIFFISNYGGNYMANSMISQTMSVVDKGSFDITDYAKKNCIIKVSNTTFGCDHSFYKGHFYSGYPPGNSLLALPVYLVFKPVLDLFIPDSLMGYSNIRLKVIAFNIIANIFVSMLLSAVLAVLLYKFLKYFIYKKRHRLLIIFIFSFGTIMFLYSTGYYSRILACFFNFLSFYLLFRMKREGNVRNSWLFFAGLFSSFSVTLEYSQLILTVLLGLYMLSFLRNKKIFWFVFGAIIPLLLFLLYNYHIYDNPIVLIQNYHPGKFEKQYAVTKMLRYPNLERIWGSSFSINDGLFWYMPIYFLSILGLYFGFKKRRYFNEMLFISLVFILYFLLNASLIVGWQGICVFGPRYMISTIPFMMIPLAFVARKFFKLVLGMGILSIFINLLSVLYGKTVLWTHGFCEFQSNIFNQYIPLIFTRGLSNYTLNLIKYRIYDIPIWLINVLFLIGASILGLIIYLIWKSKDKRKV